MLLGALFLWPVLTQTSPFPDVFAGSLECAKLLLARSADINKWDADGKKTPLHCAVSSANSRTDMLELLVNNGADINAGIEQPAGSVLHSAVRYKQRVYYIERTLTKWVLSQKRELQLVYVSLGCSIMLG